MHKKVILFLIIIFVSLAASAETQRKVYQGPIYNIFFHPLIAYPKLAFNHNNDHLEYIDSWFVTTNEFKKIISAAYKRGFVLVSPKDLFLEKTDKDGHLTITRKNLLLPAGKKPLIISLDDYNFYKNMKLHGTIHRFWVDKEGKLATITNKNNGQTIIRYDQEIPQILEDFIAKHPDFSFNQARGIIALTGYNGIFGYNTHEPYSPDYQSQLIAAKQVVNKLKKLGWEFASHSYFHLDMDKQTNANFVISENRWIKEVGSIVGPTSYYIFPFGDAWNKNAKRMSVLKSFGYKYFFGVSNTNEVTIDSDIVVLERFPMDGISLRKKTVGIQDFINPSEIIDKARLS